MRLFILYPSREKWRDHLLIFQKCWLFTYVDTIERKTSKSTIIIYVVWNQIWLCSASLQQVVEKIILSNHLTVIYCFSVPFSSKLWPSESCVYLKKRGVQVAKSCGQHCLGSEAFKQVDDVVMDEPKERPRIKLFSPLCGPTNGQLLAATNHQICACLRAKRRHDSTKRTHKKYKIIDVSFPNNKIKQ